MNVSGRIGLALMLFTLFMVGGISAFDLTPKQDTSDALFYMFVFGAGMFIIGGGSNKNDRRV